MSNRIEGKIAAILDKTTVVINRGTDHGVTRDDIFYIYSELGPFYDPDTGEELGETKRIWGKVEVTTVENKFCIARTPYRPGGFNFGVLGSMFTRPTRFQLPVDENDITEVAEKIQVGFPVISEERRAELGEEEKDVLALPSDTSSEEEEETTENLD